MIAHSQHRYWLFVQFHCLRKYYLVSCYIDPDNITREDIIQNLLYKGK